MPRPSQRGTRGHCDAYVRASPPVGSHRAAAARETDGSCFVSRRHPCEVAPPLLSIVVPTYNRWPLVREAVESALADAEVSVEVIVIDDGSTDGTAERLRGLDRRLRVMSQPNRERGAARNHGISQARGRYLAFLDADDVFEPWHVRLVAEAVEQRPDTHVFFVGSRFWDPVTGRTRPLRVARSFWRDPARAALSGTHLPLPGLVVSRHAVDQVDGFPPDREAAGSEDYVFLARILHRFEVVRLAHDGVRVREHDERSMHDSAARIASARAAGRILLTDGLDGSGHIDERSRREVVAGIDRFCAAHAYRLGNMREARAILRRMRRAIGVRRWLRSAGRLWVQTWLGAPGSRLARRVREGLPWG